MNHGPAEDFYVHLEKVAPRVWVILQGVFPVADGDMVDRDLANGSTVAEVFDNSHDEVVRVRIVRALHIRNVVPWDRNVTLGSSIKPYEERWWAERLAEKLE